MKKYLHNIMNIRLMMIALFAIVCNTSKAQQVDDSPLNPWWDSNVNGYVLRTIDSEHTVLDAMKALQEINENGTWSDYSSYTFYLTEDVDLSELDGNWVPLGKSIDNPFYSPFYCYAPTYDYYSGPTTSLGIYPKNTSESPAEDKQWEGAQKYTFNVSYIEYLFGKTKYTFNVSDIETYIGEHSDELSYSDIDGLISELESNSILYKRTDDDILIVVPDGDLSSPLSEITNSSESLESYNDDINEFISQTRSSYFVEYDESAGTLSFSTDEDLSNFTLFSCLEPTDTEDAYYKLLPNPSSFSGYFNDDPDYPTYYSTDGHIGTCKIKNMTVDGDYEAAGFFGYVDDDCDFCGFTFENCSVKSSQEDAYAGILYGKCMESGAPDIYDIFIGVNERCSITADYAGGIFGYNECKSASINSASSFSDYTFEPELSEDAYDESGYSINKIYVSIEAGKRGNKISSTDASADYTYVDAEGIETKIAFGTDENGEYGDGTEGKPFIISNKQHLLHLQSILNGINEDSYKNYEDLRDLDNLYIGSSSCAMFDGCYFKQTADLYFGDEPLTAGIGIDDTDSDTEAGPFAGTYDGDRHKITVNITSSDEYTALFANTYGATIKNLSIEGKNNNNYQYGYAAGIVGKEQSSSDYLTLDNCFVNVKIDAKHGKYGLICDCSTDYVIIKDCFNKGANNLEWFSGADEYYKYQMEQGNTISLFSWTEGGGTGTPGCPLQISSLSIFKTEKGNEFAKYGLTYELTNNTFLQDVKLVDPDGDYVGPNDTSDNDCYIEEFCGTLSGKHTYMHTYPDSSTGEVTETYIISGLTDKALFGTITGDSKIEKIGFVNCYNATNKKVNIAGSVAYGSTLTVQECYSDGYMDLGKDINTLIDCYSYSDIASVPIENFKVQGGSASWEYDDINPGRMILSDNCISTDIYNSPIYYYKVIVPDYANGSIPYEEKDLYELHSEYSDFPSIRHTDAISTIPQNNMVWNTDDPRLQFKYNVKYEDKVKYMYLTDVTALNKTSNEMSDLEINAMNFDTSYSYTIDNIYYRRLPHNDWESVALPFTYSLSSIDENFTAYTFKESDSTEGEKNVTFESMNKGATISAGQPVLFFNADKDNTAFTAKASNPTIATNMKNSDDDIFYGVLQTTGLRVAAI